MNKNYEIYGPYRHNPKFHRFPKRADELSMSEKETYKGLNPLPLYVVVEDKGT